MSEPHGAVATRSTWRQLPPYPPYGPIPPPRPDWIDGTAPLLEVPREQEVPPGRALAYIGVGLLVVALGIGLGLYLTRDAGQQTAVHDPPASSGRPQPQIVPVTPAPGPGPDADPVPQPTPDAPADPPPSDSPTPDQQAPDTQPDPGQQPGGGQPPADEPPVEVLRIFVVEPPDGLTETATMVSEEQADGRTFAEQTSVLSGAVGEVAIHAVLAPGAGERVDELLDGGEITQTLDIGGQPAWQLVGNSLVWLVREDLYVEVGAPEAVPAGDVIALAESLEILR